MEIEILYIEGCPHFVETLERVRDVVERLDVDAEIESVEVATDAQARELGFRGSPSVRVNGEDIEPESDDRTAVGRGCRVYSTPDGTHGVPPADMLEDALESR